MQCFWKFMLELSSTSWIPVFFRQLQKNNVYKGNWICINWFLKGACPFLNKGLENISLNSYHLIKFSQAVLGHG